MIKLSATTLKLQAVLANAVTTNQLHCIVSYSDHTSTAYTGGTQLTSTNGTTAVDICNAPAASTVRDIDYISIRNRDTTSATVTVMIDSSGADSEIVKTTLSPGDTLVYVHGDGWKVIDLNGQAKTSASGVGALIYQGTWNASTNTPTLASSVGTKGYYYVVSVAGTTTINGVNLWSVGDIIEFTGTIWEKRSYVLRTQLNTEPEGVPKNQHLGSAAYVDVETLAYAGTPVTVTTSTYAVASGDRWITCNYAGTVTLTLPNPASRPGRELTIKTITANAVNSASSNVAPLNDSTAGTSILSATDGKWATLVSDGSAWIIMEGN